MKRIISIFLTMMIMISTIGCRSKEDDPIEKKDTKVAYLIKVEKSAQYGIVKIMGKTGYWQEIPNNYLN